MAGILELDALLSSMEPALIDGELCFVPYRVRCRIT